MHSVYVPFCFCYHDFLCDVLSFCYSQVVSYQEVNLGADLREKGAGKRLHGFPFPKPGSRFAKV